MDIARARVDPVRVDTRRHGVARVCLYVHVCVARAVPGADVAIRHRLLSDVHGGCPGAPQPRRIALLRRLVYGSHRILFVRHGYHRHGLYPCHIHRADSSER